ncbi:MAG: hypothetical protein GY855_13080 [candidate division Zixibacteria bacterium]|nr:hypothetical protein [candidate division Zixibacteria bacterium]
MIKEQGKRNIAYLFILIGIINYIIAEYMKTSGVWFYETFFTPIVWSGYILLLDGINHLRRNRSLIINETKNFLWMLLISIGLWYIFEFYNLFIDNWHYVNLPENKTIRFIGYFWSFATIWPAIFETYIFLTGIKLFSKLRVKKQMLSTKTFYILVIIGFVFEILPFVFPNRYWAPIIWTGFILLLDPINYKLGRPSLFREWKDGSMSALFRLFTSGFICGLLWEFWNYWAGAKWVYTVPYFGDAKLFEMPVIGFLGFLPFAVEVFVLYVFIGWLFERILRIKGIGFRL